MSMRFFASWLDSVFAGFDGAVINFMHALAVSAGAVLTPVMKFITLIGEKGIIVLVLALVLMCFAKTRRVGICVFGAVCCGALITSICLKGAVARMRPLEASETYQAFWQFVGAPFEDGFSFPSGHVTAVMAGMCALCAALGKRGKRYIIPSAVFVLLMGVSRIYLMAHYPSDVIGGILVGALSAVIAFYITRLIYKLLEKYHDNAFCKFVLEFDVRRILNEKRKKIS